MDANVGAIIHRPQGKGLITEKKIRKAIRAYLIKDGKVLAITYNKENIGYYDIPGGKIEDGETPEETSIREFKEETGMTIIKQHHVGHGAIEYPDRIYDFEIFIVDDFEGNPSNEEENNSSYLIGLLERLI